MAFALSLPFVNVCISSTSEDVIATLDVCSPQAPGTSANTTSLTEPVFEFPFMMQIAYLPAEHILIPDTKFFSPIDKPPVA